MYARISVPNRSPTWAGPMPKRAFISGWSDGSRKEMAMRKQVQMNAPAAMGGICSIRHGEDDALDAVALASAGGSSAADVLVLERAMTSCTPFISSIAPPAARNGASNPAVWNSRPPRGGPPREPSPRAASVQPMASPTIFSGTARMTSDPAAVSKKADAPPWTDRRSSAAMVKCNGSSNLSMKANARTEMD
eukprot:1793242-Pleurochrysis_carterae.AAC.1